MKAMRKSKCVYCVKGIHFDLSTIGIKATPCYICDIDEWDETVRCKEGWCKYYKREQEKRGER